MLFRIWNEKDEIRESTSALTAVRLQKLSINFIFSHLSYDQPKLGCALLISHTSADTVYTDELRTVLINDSILFSLLNVQLKVVHHRVNFWLDFSL